MYNNLIVETREDIKKIIKDKELMEEVSFCFYNEITKYKNPTLNSLGICCVSWTILAAKLKYSYVMDFNWQFLCRTYNVNFDELIKNNVEIFEDTSLAGVANNLKISYERRESAIGWVQYYSAVSSLCLYLAGSTHIERYSGLKQLNNHKELLGYFNTIKISDIDAHLESEFIRNYIISNYPLCSDYDDIIQMEYFNRQYRNMPRKTNLNTCTKNKLIHEVLKSFLLYYKDDGEVTLVRFRVFIYYFHESLGEYSINNYEDFNEQTCIKQFNFYSQLTESYIQKGIIKSKKSYFESIIIYFYRYMIEYCEKENDL